MPAFVTSTFSLEGAASSKMLRTRIKLSYQNVNPF
jgi:hypothetical protein